jgi:hypothetical protein
MSLASWKVHAAFAAGFLVVLAHAPIASAQPGMGIGNAPGGGGVQPPRAPAISSIAAEQVPGQKFRIHGQVSDDTPGTCGVVITGAANGVAMCDANGNFDVTLNVPVPGNITAVPGDGTQSGPGVTVALTNVAPTCSVIAVHGPNNAWTFSGSVGDECPAGLTVTLTGPAGVNGQTATVAAGGAWSVTVTLSPNASGTVTATVTDWYGLTGSGSTYFGS